MLLSASMKPASISVRVLVVDDDEMSRELLHVLLETEGYAVTTADSGEAALAGLGSSTPAPDLILSDMQMPGTTGSALAAELRSATGGETVLLAMSGSQPSEDAVREFDGFLLKPFNLHQLAEAMDHAQQQRARSGGQDGEAPAQRSPGKVLPFTNGDSSRSSTGTGIAAELPVVSPVIFEQLSRTMPAPQLREMYSMCINDARERIRRMRGSVQEQDAAPFIREAHAIKGSAGMLGATQIHTMASDLEIRGLDGASAGLDTVNSLDELSAACDRLERMLGSRA